mmetsp:Transcript_86223/g.155313  ORF Transcript_86223/g.155313 Transcript_86223/m.155313 type:complete len:82 (+) Transcript_86223:628-873(+)
MTSRMPSLVVLTVVLTVLLTSKSGLVLGPHGLQVLTVAAHWTLPPARSQDEREPSQRPTGTKPCPWCKTHLATTALGLALG